jgi:LEA14-like dessication related protein
VRLASAAVALFALTLGCKTAAPKGEGGAPEIPSQELQVTQSLTDFQLKFVGKVTGPEGAKVDSAAWELVVDSKVVNSGTAPVNATLSGGAADFAFSTSSRYVANAEELKAMDARGGSLLVALRGKLLLKNGDATLEVPFARSREVRTPRLPHMKMHELEGARFNESEAGITFHLGVINPNPFEISVSQISYDVQVAGKPVEKGEIGKGERVNPSSTGVFDVEVKVEEATHGKDVLKLIKSQVLPYVVTGTLTADLFTEQFEFKGDLKLNVTK